MGMNTSMPGQEGIPSVFSPMARTLEDLVYFSRSLIGMKPWLWDHSVHPIEWRTDPEQKVKETKKFKIGVLRTDGKTGGPRSIPPPPKKLTKPLQGVVDPSPACARALERTVSALSSQGHTLIDVSPPSPSTALLIASQLLNSDGCKTFLSYFRTGETNDPGARQLSLYMKIPRPFKYLYYLWVKYIRRDSLWADLLANWNEKSAYEQWKWVTKREAYKASWHEWWKGEELDFMLTPVNATPAVPHGGMKEAVSSCGYTFLFNLVRPLFLYQTLPKYGKLSIDKLEPARLHLRRHAHHPRQQVPRSTPSNLSVQKFERRGPRCVSALRRRQDAWAAPGDPSGWAKIAGRKGARGHGQDRGGVGGNGG